MAQGTYKVGEVIEVTYQATNSATGLEDIKMEIYDEMGAKDGVGFPDGMMTEISETGRYKRPFTPDAEGKWRVMISGPTTGKAVKDYDVVAHNVDSVGDAVGAVDGKADGIKSKTDTLPASPANEVTAAAVKAKTDNLPASPANETTSTAVKAKTDNLPADPASEGNIRGADDDTLKTLSDQMDGISGTIGDAPPMMG